MTSLKRIPPRRSVPHQGLLEPDPRHQGQPRDAVALRSARPRAIWSKISTPCSATRCSSTSRGAGAALGRRDRVRQPHRELHALRQAPRRPDQGQHPSRLRGRLGAHPARRRGRDRARGRSPPARRQRDLRARPLPAFAGVAVGGGFLQHQAAARRSARARHQRFPRLHRRASGIRAALHERDPRPRREPPHAGDVRRARPGDAAQPSQRGVPRRDGAAFQRAAHRPLGRQALPAARGRQLHARRKRASRPPAVLRASRPRERLVAGAGGADRHHRAQEGGGLSRISRQARRADQALQPLLLRRRAEPAGAQDAASRSPSSWST